MLKLEDLRAISNEIAPYEISYKTIENGGYDNSGILVRCHEEVERILFSLDLSDQVINKAKRLKADTIVTHHPAIYSPLKSLDVNQGVSSSVTLAVKNNVNVISNHLNLDMTVGGIDECLCEGLSGEKGRILDPLYGEFGYGREFKLSGEKLSQFVSKIKKVFATNRVVVYGKKNTILSSGASFCGGGADHAISAIRKGDLVADVIVSSDLSHHQIKEIVECGKCLVILTHYSSENYGFKKFYQKVSEIIKGKAETFYFEDGRFM